MLNRKPIFAELFGLVIFDLKGLKSFKEENNIGDDILDVLISSDLGDKISESGIAIPIVNIPGDYYYFVISHRNKTNRYLNNNQISITSKGWILLNEENEVYVCGVGYLKKFNENFIKEISIKLDIDKGWNEIEILGGIDNEDRLVYEIITNGTTVKPVFYGNLEDSFNIIQ